MTWLMLHKNHSRCTSCTYDIRRKILYDNLIYDIFVLQYQLPEVLEFRLFESVALFNWNPLTSTNKMPIATTIRC